MDVGRYDGNGPAGFAAPVPAMSAGTFLAWETGDPARLRDLLAVAGFRALPGGALAIPGLVLAVTPSSGADRLRPALPSEVERGAVPPERTDEPGGPRLLGVAFATVDMERAGAAFEGLRGELPGDEILGARMARSGIAGVVLAEPRTEGRLAATLARQGEGPAALYVAVASGALDVVRAWLTAAGERPRRGVGPFGRQVLARSRPPWGPHLLLVAETPLDAAAPMDDRPSPRRSGTIQP
jgi:hypothetical protein